MLCEGHKIRESCSVSSFETLSYNFLQPNTKAMLVSAFGTKGQEENGGVYLSCWGSKSQEDIRSPCLSWKSLDGTGEQDMVIGHETCGKIATQGHIPDELWNHRSS